jgi:Domain of unknown function (DUF5615)
VGTLSSELGPLADARAESPRVYADANVPAGLVAFMRVALSWDVFFVMEHADLRRARDIDHFRLSRRLHRTLITMDRDYLDDRRYPPAETAGVLVLSAPNQGGFERLLDRVNREMFHRPAGELVPLPLEGAKLQVFPEFGAR